MLAARLHSARCVHRNSRKVLLRVAAARRACRAQQHRAESVVTNKVAAITAAPSSNDWRAFLPLLGVAAVVAAADTSDTECKQALIEKTTLAKVSDRYSVGKPLGEGAYGECLSTFCSGDSVNNEGLNHSDCSDTLLLKILIIRLHEP
eukprot:14821-Heterococcus_DN1.PRE.1